MPSVPPIRSEPAETRKWTIDSRNLSEYNAVYENPEIGHKKKLIKVSLCLTNNPQK